MTILVTGGAGFIGSHIVDALLAQNHEVIVVDNFSTGSKDNCNSQARYYEIDITDEKLADIFTTHKPEVVVHCAAQIDVGKSVKDPVWDAEQNIIGSLNILQNCIKHNVKKIVFSSTGGALYGETENRPTPEDHPAFPESPYGIGKLTTEHYIHFYHRIHGLNYVILRYSNVYGPRQNTKGEAGVIAIFISKLMAGEAPMINGSGEHTRDYVYVADVVAANLAAVAAKQNGVYNVGTGKETSLNDLAQHIKRELQSSLPIPHGDPRPGDILHSSIDASRLARELQCHPQVTIDQGINQTVAWFQQKQ